jgi:hypothetical protein
MDSRDGQLRGDGSNETLITVSSRGVQAAALY